ncbi:MAG: hypothetical protein PHU30_07915, partial [Oscillospiraceae bacterium]|nr:hypothetical protein [Oscillospiraceae bacterium]
CFVFVSGYLSKRIHKDGKLRAEKVLSFLWLYLLFKAALAVIAALFGKGFDLQLFVDGAAPWYLLSMAVWYLMIPLIERIRPFWMITLSFAAGLAAGYVEVIGARFSMSRNLVYLPFFVIGFYLTGEQLKRFLKLRLRVAAAMIMVLLLAVCVAFYSPLQPYLGIMYGGKSYYGFAKQWDPALGALVRLMWYGAAVLLSSCLVMLVPRCKRWFSKFGPRTLQIYVLHVLLKSIFSYSGAGKLVAGLPAVWGWLLLVVGSVLLTVVLGNVLFKRLFDVLGATALLKRIMTDE